MRIVVLMSVADSIAVPETIMETTEQVDKLIDALETAARLVWGPDWRDTKPTPPKKETK